MFPVADLQHAIHGIVQGAERDPVQHRNPQERRHVERQPIVARIQNHVVRALQRGYAFPHLLERSAGIHRVPVRAAPLDHADGAAPGDFEQSSRKSPASADRHGRDVVSAAAQFLRQLQQGSFDASGPSIADGGDGRSHKQDSKRLAHFFKAYILSCRAGRGSYDVNQCDV